MSEYNCLESINSMYVERTKDGYYDQPCCLWKESGDTPTVKNITDLGKSKRIKNIQERFKGDWQRPECEDCVLSEKGGQISKRQYSLKRNKDKITVWDIRPENTCNLKCVMCNPRNSSKWAEDIDLFLKYADKENNPEKLARLKKEFSIRKTLDWDWILERCINTAEKIYIAGGEPFYMKSVHDFLDKLSKQKWNRQNTRIEIQTNGVSNTDRFLSILEKFDNLMFLMSVDGWGSVNELIRFPTKHEVFVSNVEQLTSLTDQFSFNITVQALNLPNVDKTVKKLSKWGHCSMHKLWTPDYLDINCLAPVIIKEVSKSTDLPQIKGYIDDYEYNHNLRNKMLQYLKELDKARGTNSKKVLPWCYRAF
tara:strand:- start:1951 stop:3048 length:1098 start_codon:yes stop_codon:yes gene_type:complete